MKIKKYSPKNKFIYSVIIALVVSIISILIGKGGLTETLNTQFFDYKTNLFAHNLKPDSNIVLIVIDQGSLEYFEKNAISWPWPRSFYGIVLDYLKKEGAQSVLFDIDFSSTEVERLETDANTSQADFATSIKNNDNAILISSLEYRTIPSNSMNPKYFINENIAKSYKGVYNSSVCPINSFQESSRLMGIANVEKDRDGIIRTVPLIYNYDSKYLMNVSFLQFVNQFKGNVTGINSILEKLPLDDSCRFTINWYGPGLNKSQFKYYPFHTIFASAVQGDQLNHKLPADYLKNKMVVIGGAAFGLLDYKPVPIWNGPPYPGMEIHATVLSNLTQNHFIRSVPGSISAVIVIILCLLVSLSILLFIKKRYAVISLFLLLFLYVGLDFTLFSYQRINLDTGSSVFSFILITIVTSFFAFVFEGREKRNIKKIFSRYLSAHVINELMNNPADLYLTGKDAEVTVFFSDIENFTSISETLDPRELVELLNRYFSFISDIIFSYEAMLDKYIGDSVMAIFGAPLHNQDHALMACKAAIEIRQESKKFNLDKNIKLKTRIGINSGNVVLGNVGSKQRLDYTAIGDTVNIASRLESINKYFGTELLISESTYEQVKGKAIVREIDLAKVKGKDNPVRIYELLGIQEEDSYLSPSDLDIFQQGLQKYRAGEYEDSKKLLESLFVNKGDTVSQVYLDRIEKLKNDPSTHGVEGVHIFLTK